MPKLDVIIASTRPGRVGLPVGTWFEAFARQHGKLDVRVIDLATLNLPMLDEPKHPRFAQYEKAHTKAWSATIAESDCFVFVTPEYNYAAPPSLMNALNFLFHEWAYKPVGFVSYGGIAGGTRAVQMLKLVVTALRMMPLPEGVIIPFVAKQIEGDVFKASETNEQAAATMLNELARWAGALAPMRQKP
jgi:NAD(P)H-dependent FMN reductase